MAFTDPKKNLERLHFPISGTVADFGAGSGYYAFLLAERLSDNHGKVIAIDIQRDLLSKLKAEAIRRGLENIETVWGDLEEMRGTGLPDMSADAAIVSNILFQMNEKDVFAQELYRIVRNSGEVLVIDWEPTAVETLGVKEPPREAGVHPVFRNAGHLSAQDAQKLFERHGFTQTECFDAGDHHWGLVFKKT